MSENGEALKALILRNNLIGPPAHKFAVLSLDRLYVLPLSKWIQVTGAYC